MQIKNPELLRYVRSELRPGRMWAIVGGVVVTFGIVTSIHWNTSFDEHLRLVPSQLWRGVHEGLFGVTGFVLVFWSIIACAQSLVSERTQNTFDLWRTTSVATSESIIGKLFGPTLGPWLQYILCFPLLSATALSAHIDLSAFYRSYALVALYVVAVNLIALCVSSRAKDPRQAQFFAFLTVVPLWIPEFTTLHIGHPGFKLSTSSWSTPLPSVMSWYSGDSPGNAVWSHSVPLSLVPVCVYVLTALWTVVVLHRVIRKLPEQIALLSHVQGIAIAVTLLFIGTLSVHTGLPNDWAFLSVRPGVIIDGDRAPHWVQTQLLGTEATLCIVASYLMILLTIEPREVFAKMVREERWRAVLKLLLRILAAVAVCVGLAAFHAIVVHRGSFPKLPISFAPLLSFGCILAAMLFRDSLLIQWFVSRTGRAPLLQALGVLAAYYLLALTLQDARFSLGRLLLPAVGASWTIALMEVVLQGGIALALAKLIVTKYQSSPQRPVDLSPAASVSHA